MDDRQKLAFIEAYFSAGWTNRLELILPTAPTSIPLDQFINSLPKNVINQQVNKVKSTEPTHHQQRQQNTNQNTTQNNHQTSIQPQQQSSANVQITTQINEKYKTTLCNSFVHFGECKYGGSCLFAHGHSELRLMPKFSENGIKIGSGDCCGNKFKRRQSEDFGHHGGRHNANYRTSVRKM
ncbi:unnamed protein product [Meloidogyne enterolobii]|uniref:Uncharacterized protein n=1 Tax=Meloidogyne enterolobii TaxID=390850 RepID=A0ACB0YCV2_MELEN